MNLFFFKKNHRSEQTSSKLSTNFPQSASSHFAKAFPLKQLEIEGITVTYEDRASHLEHYFSKSEQKRFQELLYEAQIYPQKAYPEVLAWQKHSPKVPELDNLLTYLHLQNKKVLLAEALIEESYKNYPGYLFAQINYADQALRKKNLKVILEIFPSLSLSEIFKNKKQVHVSEFRGLMVLLSRYHWQVKQKELATSYYKKAYLADPTHPSVVSLEKHLFSTNYFKRLLTSFRLLYKKPLKIGSAWS